MSTKNVVLSHISKAYTGQSRKSVLAVDDVSLEIPSGQFVTLLGPSGCGKTTILRMIAGFEAPSSGDISIGGERITDVSPDRRDTAMVFQSYALFPHLSIQENIAYGLKIKKINHSEIKNRVEEMLNLVGLSGLETRCPNQLSGGQQQRVALARALIMQPSVLLFDEPLSNLDAKLRVQMRGEIRRLQRKMGITSIYVTHDQAEAMSMSDRIVIMKSGKLEQSGTPWEIYNKPVSEFVADFIGMANIVEGKVIEIEGNTAIVETLGHAFRVAATEEITVGSEVKVVLRPETVALSTETGIPGKVEASVYMGASQDYKIRVGKVLLTVIVYNPVQQKVFPEGSDIFLQCNEHQLHIVKK